MTKGAKEKLLLAVEELRQEGGALRDEFIMDQQDWITREQDWADRVCKLVPERYRGRLEKFYKKIELQTGPTTFVMKSTCTFDETVTFAQAMACHKERLEILFDVKGFMELEHAGRNQDPHDLTKAENAKGRRAPNPGLQRVIDWLVYENPGLSIEKILQWLHDDHGTEAKALEVDVDDCDFVWVSVDTGYKGDKYEFHLRDGNIIDSIKGRSLEPYYKCARDKKRAADN